jgi:hypothetical protein
MQIWRLEDGEIHWVVAADEADARQVLVEDMRACGLDDYTVDEIQSCTQVPSDQPFTIRDDEGVGVTQTAAEWASGGRCYLAGTCW